MAYDYSKQGRSRVISQYRSDPALNALLHGFGELLRLQMETACDVRRLLYSIDDMEGVQLDLIGRVLVQPRPGITNTAIPFFGYDGTPGAVGYNVAPYYDYNRAGEVLVPLPDAYYKRLLKAKTIKNTSDCSIDQIIQIVEVVTGDNAVTLNNGFDLTFAIVLSQTPDDVTTLLLNNYPFIPVPIGVQFTGWSVAP